MELDRLEALGWNAPGEKGMIVVKLGAGVRQQFAEAVNADNWSADAVKVAEMMRTNNLEVDDLVIQVADGDSPLDSNPSLQHVVNRCLARIQNFEARRDAEAAEVDVTTEGDWRDDTDGYAEEDDDAAMETSIVSATKAGMEHFKAVVAPFSCKEDGDRRLRQLPNPIIPAPSPYMHMMQADGNDLCMDAASFHAVDVAMFCPSTLFNVQMPCVSPPAPSSSDPLLCFCCSMCNVSALR
jgi:hypothetical protein